MNARRELLKRLTMSALGTIALAGVANAEKGVLNFAKAIAKEEAPPLPWPYKRLDITEVRRRAYLGYYVFECGGGAFWGLASYLKDLIGYPWTLLPIPDLDVVVDAAEKHKEIPGILQYGFGGTVGWGVLCGSLNGSIAIMNMVIKEKKHWVTIGRMLMRYYEVTPFPSKETSEFVMEGKMYVKHPKYPGPLPQSVSNSTLCHVSVGKWCIRSGYASGSKERSERCARLTADVAAHAAELLNAYFEGGLTKVEEVQKFKLSATTAACRKCHYKGKDFEIGQFTRGYLACESCHRDLTAHAHQFLAKGPTGSELMSVALSAGGIGAFAGFLAGVASSSPKSEEEGEEK